MTMKNTTEKTGFDLLTAFMDANKLDIKQLALVLGVARVTIYQWLDGKKPVLEYTKYHIEALNNLPKTTLNRLIEERTEHGQTR